MKASMRVTAGLVACTSLVAVTLTGCGDKSKPSNASTTSATSTTTSASATSAAPAQPSDYTGLLIKGADIVAPEAFTPRPPIANPNGQPGVAGSFANADGSHVIGDTILILPDPSAAMRALESAKAALGNNVKGTPAPAPIGTGGTTVTGNSPDGTKSLTVLMFTQGNAFTTMEFDGPADAAPPPDFVTDLGQKQATAIKNGLPG